MSAVRSMYPRRPRCAVVGFRSRSRVSQLVKQLVLLGPESGQALLDRRPGRDECVSAPLGMESVKGGLGIIGNERPDPGLLRLLADLFELGIDLAELVQRPAHAAGEGPQTTFDQPPHDVSLRPLDDDTGSIPVLRLPPVIAQTTTLVGQRTRSGQLGTETPVFPGPARQLAHCARTALPRAVGSRPRRQRPPPTHGQLGELTGFDPGPGRVDGERVRWTGLRLDADRMRRVVHHDARRVVKDLHLDGTRPPERDRPDVDEAVVPRTRARFHELARTDPLRITLEPRRLRHVHVEFESAPAFETTTEPRVPTERDGHCVVARDDTEHLGQTGSGQADQVRDRRRERPRRCEFAADAGAEQRPVMRTGEQFPRSIERRAVNRVGSHVRRHRERLVLEGELAVTDTSGERNHHVRAPPEGMVAVGPLLEQLETVDSETRQPSTRGQVDLDGTGTCGEKHGKSLARRSVRRATSDRSAFRGSGRTGL